MDVADRPGSEARCRALRPARAALAFTLVLEVIVELPEMVRRQLLQTYLADARDDVPANERLVPPVGRGPEVWLNVREPLFEVARERLASVADSHALPDGLPRRLQLLDGIRLGLREK